MTALVTHAPHRLADPMDAPPLRWGVLGAGWIADVFARSVLGHTRSRIQAVGSRDAHRGNALRAAIRRCQQCVRGGRVRAAG